MDANVNNNSLLEKRDATTSKPESNAATGDKSNIFLLFILYTLQGVSIGITYAIPIILQSKKHISYNDQAKFSFATWAFGMKILWAPLVDSTYVRRFGRRKSWLIPVQSSIGIFFLVVGFFINEWLINVDKPNVMALAVMFFVLNFLTATQDIVVDGWAVTMLKRKNIGYAAMCGSAGQSFGIFLGFIFLIFLMSETFWNKWRSSPQPTGIVSLQEYFYFWGVMCITVTTLIALFKTEKNYDTDNAAVHPNILKTYKLLFRIVKLPSIKMLAIVLLTLFVSFSSIDAAYKLKLIDGGVTKDEIAAIELFLVPLQISSSILITKFMSEKKPLKHLLNFIAYRLLVVVIFTIVIYFTPTFLAKTGPLLIAYKICLVLTYSLEQCLAYAMMQMRVEFYTNISDPKVGGTYMTLLNTIGNISLLGTRTAALKFIDVFTFKSNCINTNPCSSANYNGKYQRLCESSGETCQVKVDGFYVVTVVCIIYGVVWYFMIKKYVNKLQSKNLNEWYVETKIKERTEDHSL